MSQEANRNKLIPILCKDSERSLRSRVDLLIRWVKQFEIMKEKMLEVISELIFLE